MHGDAVVPLVHDREYTTQVDLRVLTQAKERPGAVFPAAPAEQGLFLLQDRIPLGVVRMLKKQNVEPQNVTVHISTAKRNRPIYS